MSLTFEVSLISGKTVSLRADADESVKSLRVRAQKALGIGKGRLLDSTGSLLDGGAPLKQARLQNAEPNVQPEPLTLQVGRVGISGGRMACAAILGDGSVVTWGGFGSRSSAVRNQLKNVEQIQAAWYAFAAVLGDGSVVTWGLPVAGGGQQWRARSAKDCAADSSNFSSFCCDPARWLRCDLGRW